MEPFLQGLGAGRFNERSFSGAVNDGVDVIPVDLTGNPYSVGQYAVISDLGGTNFQFLGQIKAIGAADITAEMGVQGNRLSTARIWVATWGFRFSNAGQAEKRPREGPVFQRTAGGGVHKSRDKAELEEVNIDFRKGNPDDAQGLSDFMANFRRDYLDDVTLFWMDRKARKSRCSIVALDKSAEGYSQGLETELASYSVEGVILALDGYQDT